MRKIKYTLMGIMMFLYIMLMGISITGEYNHKLIGISFFAIVALILISNYKWFMNLKTILVNSGNNLLNVLWLLVDFFILIDIAVMIVTSVILFAAGDGMDKCAFVHKFGAYAGYLLISVWIGMHWQMVMNSLRKAFNVKNESKARRIILRIIVVMVIFFGINAYGNRNLGDKFTYYGDSKKNVQEEKKDYVGNLYLDYILISGVYVAVGHYAVKLINKVNKKRR